MPHLSADELGPALGRGPAGPVRPPLTDLTAPELTALVDTIA